MSDDEYTNLDLDTAEALLIAAGRPELAQALRYQAQGVRNLVQGEWGQSFASALESILARHIGELKTEIGGLRGDTNALQAEFHAGLQGIQSTVSELAETVDGLQARVQEIDKRDAKQYKETQRQFRESEARQRQMMKDLVAQREEFKQYVAGSRRAEVDALKAQVEELAAPRRKYTPEQIQVMTDVLPRMIADWLAAHPDEAHGDGSA